MYLALDQAHAAEQAGEVPVGALILGPDGTILARAANGPIAAHDPTAHAEIIALRRAAAAIRNYRLEGCTCVVTLEPCLMCVGALIHARIATVAFGAHDPKAGAVVSRLPGPQLDFINHRFAVVPGILADTCADTLRAFFAARRGK